MAIMLLVAMGKQSFAQVDTLTLEKAIDAAMKNNRLLNIKRIQVDEKQAKVKEDEIKKFIRVESIKFNREEDLKKLLNYCISLDDKQL